MLAPFAAAICRHKLLLIAIETYNSTFIATIDILE